MEKLYEVSTEMDERGILKSLGVFKGSIEDIAFFLQNRAYYTLRFKHIEIKDMTEEKLKHAVVNKRDDTLQIEVPSEDTVEMGRFHDMVKEDNFGSTIRVTFVLDRLAKKQKEQKSLKDSILGKLSEDELKFLKNNNL